MNCSYSKQINKVLEMMSDAPKNVEKHVTLNIARACSRYTNNYKSSDWPKWCCALWHYRYIISRLGSEHRMSFQAYCRYVDLGVDSVASRNPQIQELYLWGISEQGVKSRRHEDRMHAFVISMAYHLGPHLVCSSLSVVI